MSKKILTICIVGMFLLITTVALPVSSIKSIGIRIQHNDADTPATILSAGSLSVDLEARKPGDTTWQKSISAKVGTKLEFKISITSSSIEDVMAVIQFPRINDEILLNYVSLSASSPPLPIPVDDVVIWGFPGTPPSEITFKAEIKKSGTGPVGLNVGGNDISNSQYLEDADSVQVTGSGCCFPAGTKITMADGSFKNIEDVKIGDRVLSYDFEKKEFDSWIVKMLGNPVHPIYEINDGLICSTNDHPFYIKKSDGKTGIGAINAKQCENSIIFEGEVFQLEVNDSVYTLECEWIKITNITFKEDSVQTYNILSFSGKHNYFANGILVYEEHPPYSFTNARLEKILEKHPFFTKIILSLPFFQKLLIPY